MKLYLKNLLPSRKKNSEFIDIYLQKLAKIISALETNKLSKIHDKDKGESYNIQFPLKIFINSLLVFLHELCFLIPLKINDK